MDNVFCTKCGASRPSQDSPCPNCQAEKYRSPLLATRVEGSLGDLREDRGDEPNEVRAVATQLRSLPSPDQIWIFDAMIFTAQTKHSIRQSDVHTVYEALILTGLNQVHRMSVLRKLLGNAKAPPPSGFPEIHEPASQWLMLRLIELAEDGANASAYRFLNDFASHIGLKPSARERFFAEVRQKLTLDGLFKFLNVGVAFANVKGAYDDQGVTAAFRTFGEQQGTFIEAAKQASSPVGVVREPQQIKHQLVDQKQKVNPGRWRWWRRGTQPRREVTDPRPTYLPGTDDRALVRSFVRGLHEDLARLNQPCFLEWPSARRFRRTATQYLSAIDQSFGAILSELWDQAPSRQRS